MALLLATYLWTLILKISSLDKTNKKQHKAVLRLGAKLSSICVVMYNVKRTSKKVGNTTAVSKNKIQE